MNDPAATYAFYSMIAASVQAMAALTLIWVTWRYVVLTRQLVHETQRSVRPRVYVDLENAGRFNYYIRVSNQGNEAARGIRFTLLKDFAWPDPKWPDMRLETQHWFRDGLRLCTPGSTLRYHLHADVAHLQRNLGSDDLRAEATTPEEVPR
jgi:hypothetical protein